MSQLTALFGLAFFAIYFVYYNPLSTRSFPPFPRVIIWFAIYIAVYALNGFFLPGERLREFYTRLFTLVQVITFFWIASDLLKYDKMLRNAVLAFSVATFILALGLVFPIPGLAPAEEIGIERASVGPLNANSLASVTALGAVALVGLWVNLSQKRLVASVCIFGSVFALSVATVYTGSRGGVVMLMVGLSVYLAPYWKKRRRMFSVVVAFLAIVGLAYVAATSPVFSERWLEYYDGRESTRDRIYEELLIMISQRPLFGWQPIEFRYELGGRTGITGVRDAHNTFLHVMAEVGIIGGVPFLIGLWLCFMGAWKARNRNTGLLPLALLVTSLAGGMTSTTIYYKAMWFVLAVSVAAKGDGERPGIIPIARRVHVRPSTQSLRPPVQHPYSRIRR